MDRRREPPRRQRLADSDAGYDAPFAFGVPPSADRPHPFRLWEFAQLLLLRGRFIDGDFADDRTGRYLFSQHHGTVYIEREGDTYFRRPMEVN